MEEFDTLDISYESFSVNEYRLARGQNIECGHNYAAAKMNLISDCQWLKGKIV